MFKLFNYYTQVRGFYLNLSNYEHIPLSRLTQFELKIYDPMITEDIILKRVIREAPELFFFVADSSEKWIHHCIHYCQFAKIDGIWQSVTFDESMKKFFLAFRQVSGVSELKLNELRYHPNFDTPY